MPDAYSWGTPNSQVIRSGQQVRDDWNTYNNNYQSQMEALRYAMANIATPQENAFNQATQHANSGAFDQFFRDQAAINPIWNDAAQQDWYKQEYARDVGPTLLTGGADPWSAQYINKFDGLKSAASYDPAKVAADYSGQMKSLTDAWTKEKGVFDDYIAGEERQNASYKGMLGGGFTGGFTNEEYTNPFAGTAGQDGATTFGSLAANPGASLGQSTPTGIVAKGQNTGFGTMQGQGMPKQLTAGWGGPFDQWRF